MFKIINGVVVSTLILIVSIACSSAPLEEYITVDEYNKLLTQTSELKERIKTLESKIIIVDEDILILDKTQERNCNSDKYFRGVAVTRQLNAMPRDSLGCRLITTPAKKDCEDIGASAMGRMTYLDLLNKSGQYITCNWSSYR